MAEGCYISTMQTTSSKVAHMVESWTVIYDKNENGVENLMKGVIKTTISTFGVPAGHTGADVDNNLYIKLLLVDNLTVLEMDFPVGDQIANINEYDGTHFDEDGNIVWPEIHVEWPEPLPHVDNVDGKGGAFDVGVDNWGDGDEVITELPLI